MGLGKDDVDAVCDVYTTLAGRARGVGRGLFEDEGSDDEGVIGITCC